MSGYVLGPDVEFDLEDIWEYIAQDSIDAADRWINQLFDACTALAQDPGLGHRRGDLTALPILFWSVGAYLIIYRRQPSHIEIVAITQGARGIPTLLRRRIK